MYTQFGSITVYKSSGDGMNTDLNVVYLVDGVQIRRCMTQLELSELLKHDDVLLLSVNVPTVKHYRRKAKKDGRA